MAKVLVVDDDADTCEIARRFLSSQGFGVDCANNGKEALSVILEEKPDVVVLDLCMPGMNGEKLIEILRSYLRLQAIPVVVWTGVQDFETIERARKHGANQVLVKGKANLDDLTSAIQSELHRE